MSVSSRKSLFPGRSLQVDMSPMIDLVFLLLIFFMVSSTMITYRQDPNVKIPVASAGCLGGRTLPCLSSLSVVLHSG